MNDNIHQLLQTIQHALQQTLGSQLLSLYLFGDLAQDRYIPGLSSIDLLAIIQDQTNIHQIRETLQPIWQQNSQIIRPMPLIATPAALDRHLQLYPLLAHELNQNGRLLTGQPHPIKTQPTDPVERISHLALQALQASESLAPELLEEDQARTATQNLKHLANQLQIKTAQSTTPTQTLAAIYAHLDAQLEQYPSLKRQAPIPTDAPPLIPNLLSIYEVHDRAIFLLPDWPPSKIQTYINNIDWTAVSQTLKNQYYGLQLTTPSLIRLIYQHQRPTDTLFKSYQHAWGQHHLETLKPTHDLLYRDLARQPSQLQIETFPHAYLTATDDQLNKLIHDFQNKLLNIQLREELISRHENRPRALPPDLPSDRDIPSSQRIDAIFHQVNWWANHYTTVG